MADINEHIQKARDEAEKIEPLSVAEKKALDKLKTELHKGSQEEAARQKRIKVADRSDFGWAVAEAYDSDELAENSDDEKGFSELRKMQREKLLSERSDCLKEKRNPYRSCH